MCEFLFYKKMSINFNYNLLIISKNECCPKLDASIDDLKSSFCGVVWTQPPDEGKSDADPPKFENFKCIYLAGNIATLKNTQHHHIIKELSVHCDESEKMISVGKVPRSIHGCGVYYPCLFDTSYFETVEKDHSFQILTQSNKPSSAFRKGVYLSNVDKNLEYNLLRCSTNLDGPTENFTSNDHKIIQTVQRSANMTFDNAFPFNHVLAQIYENKGNKKAKISTHSDKTKDMPRNGLIAFCTFYDQKKCESDKCYTKLHFKLKKSAQELKNNNVKEFTLPLEPNSVFIIPLSVNRLYTHEIQASYLNTEKLPTRLGYVIRCSSTRAQFDEKTKTTMIETKDGQYQPLRQPTKEDVQKLKMMYATENTTTDEMNYGFIPFSLNQGDYMPPI